MLLTSAQQAAFSTGAASNNPRWGEVTARIDAAGLEHLARDAAETVELRRGDHPIRDAYALLRGEGGRVLNAAEPSDPEGLVRFGVVPAGEWRIEIRSGSTSTFLRSPIDIAADVTATRTIDLARAR